VCSSDLTVRKHSYQNHPCSRWVRESYENANWLLQLSLKLCEEKKLRYPKKPDHAILEFLHWVDKNLHVVKFSKSNLTPFPVAIADDSKCREVEGFDDLDVILKYRLFYIYDKWHIAEWNPREKPSWYKLTV
jgi:hypothetical protein